MLSVDKQLEEPPKRAVGIKSGKAGPVLTFNEYFGPRGGDSVLVARLAHVLGLVVDRDRIDRQRASAFRVLDLNVFG